MSKDEALLAEVAATVHSDSSHDASVRVSALDKVSDRNLLLPLMDQYRDIYLGNVKRGPLDGSGDPAIREAVANAYERVDRPPFEWSMLVQSEKASENIMQDLDGMSMPEDRGLSFGLFLHLLDINRLNLPLAIYPSLSHVTIVVSVQVGSVWNRICKPERGSISPMLHHE